MALFKKRRADSDRSAGPVVPAKPGLRLHRPELDRIEYIYFEGRRLEDQSAIRTDPIPAEAYDLLGSQGILSDSGSAILPWRAQNTRNLTVAPFRRGVAFVESQMPGGPRLFTDTFESDAPLMASLPGFRVLDNRGSSVCGIEYSPTGDRIACLEWQGQGVLAILSVDDGSRTFVTTLDGVAGYEQPFWSPDGRWILVSTNFAPQLVSLDQELVVPLPLSRSQVDWWPLHGSSTLMVLGGDAPSHWVSRFDLATNTITRVAEVDVSPQEGLDSFRHHLAHPRVSPDGRRLLVGTSLGPAVAYQREHGGRQRTAIVDIETGRLRPGPSPFVDPSGWIEREHNRWRWAEVGRGYGSTQVAHELLSAASSFTGPDPCASYDFGGRDEYVVAWHW
ncbi:MAG TPA: hypothetical protein DEG43_07735 [Acidimicrobiaceae bacterium]|nr:hypothetical protein [Acidimicrobiaceae bacterium]